jgi:hypothetical protein
MSKEMLFSDFYLRVSEAFHATEILSVQVLPKKHKIQYHSIFPFLRMKLKLKILNLMKMKRKLNP